MKRTPIKTLLLGSTVAACMAVPAFDAAAGDVILFQDVPSAAEVNEVLFGKDENPMAGQRTRSIRVIEPVQQRTRAIKLHSPGSAIASQAIAAAGGAPADETEPVGLGFNLQFAFDSIQLLPESQPYIDRLGEVLGSPDNQEKTLLILGHTDATGPGDYNDTLSVNRAAAVRSYLTTAWNIPADRLQIQGAGETNPVDGADPFDGINRRVEFFALN